MLYIKKTESILKEPQTRDQHQQMAPADPHFWLLGAQKQCKSAVRTVSSMLRCKNFLIYAIKIQTFLAVTCEVKQEHFLVYLIGTLQFFLGNVI